MWYHDLKLANIKIGYAAGFTLVSSDNLIVVTRLLIREAALNYYVKNCDETCTPKISIKNCSV